MGIVSRCSFKEGLPGLHFASDIVMRDGLTAYTTSGSDIYIFGITV